MNCNHKQASYWHCFDLVHKHNLHKSCCCLPYLVIPMLKKRLLSEKEYLHCQQEVGRQNTMQLFRKSILRAGLPTQVCRLYCSGRTWRWLQFRSLHGHAVWHLFNVTYSFDLLHGDENTSWKAIKLLIVYWSYATRWNKRLTLPE